MPGVPYELEEMFERAILPDLRARLAGEGETGVIASRVLRTWGTSESALAEALDGRLDGPRRAPTSTIAFLASGIEGLKVRLTVARADGRGGAVAPSRKRRPRSARSSPSAWATSSSGRTTRRWSARSRGGSSIDPSRSRSPSRVTGGLVASRLVSVEGASRWFRGGVVSYATDVKHLLLGVPEGPVVTAGAAEAMADGRAQRRCSSDVGLALSGVAGPEPDEGVEVGTVFVGLVIGDAAPPVRAPSTARGSPADPGLRDHQRARRPAPRPRRARRPADGDEPDGQPACRWRRTQGRRGHAERAVDEPRR